MVCTLLLWSLAVLAALHGCAYLLLVFESRSHRQPEAAKPQGALWGAWLADLASLVCVVVIRPFSVLAAAPTRASSALRPVVLLHCLGGGRSSTAILAARLRRDGRDAVSLAYTIRGGATETAAEELSAAIAEAANRFGVDRVDLVAHGVGGLVARAALRRHGAGKHVANVVTLGTPHFGTALANMVRGRRSLDLRPRSGFVMRLADEDPVADAHHLVNIVSTFDAFSFPVELAYYEPASNVTLDYIGHYAMLFAESVYAIVKENIDQEPKARAPQRPA